MAEEKPILDIVNKLFNDELDPSRKIMERIWERNVLYYIGEQYLEWQVSRNTFIRKRNRKETPTPVDNIIREHVHSMKAMILNKQYTVRVWPNSNDLEDREAAKIADLVAQDMDLAKDEAFEEEKDNVSTGLPLFGTIFMRTFPESDAGEWSITADGEIITTGDVACQAMLPFNVVTDSYGDKLIQKRHVGIKSLKPKEWVEDTFKTLVKTDGDPSIIDYQKRLMKMVGQVSPWKGSGLVNSDMFDLASEDLVVFKEIEFRPTKKRPKGRYVIYVGDQEMLDNNSMPITVEKGEWHYTLTDFHYHNVPGRFWSDPSVNDLIPIQNAINEINQALEMNRKGLMRPLITMPIGMKLRRLNEGGQSMMIIEYDGMMSGGQKPEINRGLALPKQVLDERAVHKASAQDASGDPKGVLRGKTPSSQASGVLVDILREAAEQAHTPDIARFYRRLKQVYRKRLIVKKNVTTEERIVKIAGRGNELQIKKFKGADLRNNTDVRLELASSISTTNAGKGQMLSEMAKSGVFADENIPIDVRHELMQRVGLTGLKEKTNVHIEHAERENAVIACATTGDIMVETTDGEKMDVAYIPGIYTSVTTAAGEEFTVGNDETFKFHDDALHIEYHTQFALSPEFKILIPASQKILLMHMNSHQDSLEQKQQKILMQQLAAQEAMQPETTGSE